MATRTMTGGVTVEIPVSTSFERFAGVCGVVTGVAGLAYAVGFVILKSSMLYSTALLAGGLLAVPVLVALYSRLRETDQSFALLGFALAILGALGSIIHGGYDLANTINPPTADVLANANVPFLVDPRGLLVFGVAGLGMFFIAWLITRNNHFPKALGYLGYLLAVLMVIIYLGRLIVLDANSLAILIPAALAGFIVNPAWYLWT